MPDAIQLHLFARAFEERLIGLPVRESEGEALASFLIASTPTIPGGKNGAIAPAHVLMRVR